MIIAHIAGLPLEESLVPFASLLGTGSLLIYELKRRLPRARNRREHRDH